MANPSKMFEFIRLYPKLATDPVEGRKGEVYYNTTTDNLRICINATGPVWENLGERASPGTIPGSVLVYDDVAEKYVENDGITVNGFTIGGQTDSVADANKAEDVFLRGSDKSAGTGDGGDVYLEGGNSIGGLKGRIVAQGHTFLLDAPHAADPTGNAEGEIYYNTAQQAFKYFNGTNWRPIGSGGGLTKARLYDPVSSSLSTGVPVIIDGQTVANGDLVLFSNLLSGNNRIYKATVSAGNVTAWTAQNSFNGNLDPAAGDLVVMEEGDNFEIQIAKFDGTNWLVNDKVRYFNGLDYMEQSAIYSTAIANNTTDNVFTTTLLGSENLVIEYSLTRGIIKETGSIFITTDGTNVSVTSSSSTTGASGVTFSGDISGSDLRLRYTTDNAGTSGTIKFMIRRWADGAGGPGGLPVYSPAPSSVSAAGVTKNIQFNAAGVLAGNNNFNINTTDMALELGTMQYVVLNSGQINDNQTIAAPIITFDAATYKSAVIEYSVSRGANHRTGRLLIANNGSSVSITDDFVEQGSVGVLFSVDISSGSVRVLYTSTNTGVNGTMKWSYRRWA